VTAVSRRRTGDVHDVLASHASGYRVESVVPVGAGVDNDAYLVNGELIVRFSTEPDAVRRAALVSREARLLAAVAAVSPLPVPEPVFAAAEHGCLAYVGLPGVPLLDLPRHQWSERAASIAATLGDLLAALHAAPVDRWADLVDTEDHPLAEWRRRPRRPI
jgi:aminoglycoside phosphotransferase (APT) family kinase protein